MIPPALTRVVLRALAQAGEASPISKIEPVKGGFVSKSWRIVTKRRSYLLKYHEDPKPFLYSYESHGLNLLKAAGLRVPTVIAFSDKSDETPGYCIQEWIHPGSTDMQRRRLSPQLAEEIAALHSAPVEVPGYGSNYSATDGPKESWHDDWIACIRQRIQKLIDFLDEGGRMPAERWEALERLAAKLPDLLGGVDRQPALLHGDLHGRNIVANRAGEAVLIDPCVHYGDREYESSYMHLWGFYPPLFWEAYESAYPHPPGAT